MEFVCGEAEEGSGRLGLSLKVMMMIIVRFHLRYHYIIFSFTPSMQFYTRLS
jgi:hypothetical protein